ncbi:hypothetical protein HPB51_024408 [Rhipicephalus microplus]|uniref:Tick transposon n=1 Tax=Rhipicephalus microplus TaxID=6941 RepID=A0A9J6EE61_RHIMP|nr:hypothetical protein HPB51_024408 [Rhipicephalus microplus]
MIFRYCRKYSVDREIDPYLTGPDGEREFPRAAEYIYKAVTYSSKLKYRISQLQPQAELAPTSLIDPPRDARTYSHRLPRLELVKSNGTPRNLFPFWEQFQTVDHEFPTLTDVDNFVYLISALTGPDTAAIARSPASPKFDEEALAILNAWFAKEYIILKYHIKSLIDSQLVQSTTDLRGSRRLHDNIEADIRPLRELNLTEESFLTAL